MFWRWALLPAALLQAAARLLPRLPAWPAPANLLPPLPASPLLLPPASLLPHLSLAAALCLLPQPSKQQHRQTAKARRARQIRRALRAFHFEPRPCPKKAGGSEKQALPFRCARGSAKGHIHHHHNNKASQHAPCAGVRMLAQICLGNQLFHHHINHGARRKA